MLYFAYGSNMLRERLRHPRRAPGASWLQTGYVTGRKLAFHKRSWDGSGKCDIAPTGNPADRVYGVLYHVPQDQVPALDVAEAVGAGYRREQIKVFTGGSRNAWLLAETYLADPRFIDPTLAPYTWYKELVVRGALQNNFAQEVLDRISGVPALPDPEPSRATAIEAMEALQASQSILA